MKIEVQDKPFGIPFPQIEFGRVFKWENGYYLRCDDEEGMHNAVSLTTNVLCFFYGIGLCGASKCKIGY